MALLPGSRLGPYEILSPLGAGGMGEVYRARDPRLAREVAIKVISSDGEADPERLRRFADEARAAGALNHPNVLSVFDTGQDGGPPYVVFELLEGETLRHCLQRGALPPRRAVEYAAQICQGLAAAHEKGIVHRDLKPDNLFLTRDGHVKVLDFGLAKLTEVVGADADTADRVTRTATTPGLLLGTVAYMSPEQARGAPADARSDIFALGGTLYEMLTGRPAFERATLAETLSAILTQDPDEIGPSPEHPMPAALLPIVRRCLEKDPRQRFQSARDLGFALSVLSGAATTGEVGTPPTRRSSKRWLLPLVVGALAVGVLAYFFFRRSPTPAAPLTVVPFTTFRGQEIAPSFSPDGSHIAFAWTGEEQSREDNFDLYVQGIGGEKPLRLTHRPGRWMVPAWSPDGRRIAFSRAGKDGRGIYVVPALGGSERRLLDIGNENFDYSENMPLSWSPDGRLLVFANLDAPGGTGTTTSLLNVDTLEKRSLPSPSENCQWTWMPAFSPDGKSVAVVCVRVPGVNELFAIPVAGGSARSIAVVQGSFSGLTWTADGSYLVFTCNGSLWRVSAGGGEPEKLLAGRDAEWPALSRAGDRLAYTQRVANTNIWRLPLAGPMRPAGPPERLVSSSRIQRHPVFSPDGRRLVFESTRSGSFEIWVSDADGSDPVRMTSIGGPVTGSPAWSPDGRSIAFDSRASGKGAIYLIGVEGGPPRRVETGLAESSIPAWSPDGEWLYFTAWVKGDQVFKVRTEGGAPIQITKKGGYRPRVSLDGKRVYYVTWNADLWSASVDGGDERPLAGMPPRSQKWYADWALTASGMYFIEGDPPRPGIHLLDFATEKVRRIADIPGRPEIGGGGLALSPDGRSLLFSQVDEIASDIMLIEGFR